MDKLISANKLIDWIRNDSGDKLMADWYIEHINDMPEAYNPDRVIEQLKNLKPYKLDLADAMMDTLENGRYRHFICLEEAVDIVERGEIE